MKTKLEELKEQFEDVLDIFSEDQNNDESTVLKDGVLTADNMSADTTEENTTEKSTNIVEEIKEQTAPSKFKTVEELEKAYAELEKEFTRRCQRLSKLEKQLEKDKVDSDVEWKAKVDKFFSENPSAKPFAKQMSDEIIRDGSLRGRSDCLETALTRALLQAYRSPETLASDEEFLKNHILGSDFVKKAVIEGYLKDLRDGKPPMLIGKSGQNTVAPRNKPKSIAEAGRMFQQNNK